MEPAWACLALHEWDAAGLRTILFHTSTGGLGIGVGRQTGKQTPTARPCGSRQTPEIVCRPDPLKGARSQRNHRSETRPAPHPSGLPVGVQFGREPSLPVVQAAGLAHMRDAAGHGGGSNTSTKELSHHMLPSRTEHREDTAVRCMPMTPDGRQRVALGLLGEVICPLGWKILFTYQRRRTQRGSS